MTPSGDRGPRNQRGLALITVLWVVMLLAVIGGTLTMNTRTELRLARNLVESAKAEALADGAIFHAVDLLQRSVVEDRWLRVATPYDLPLADGVARVFVEDEQGKIDLNAAPDEVLIGLAQSLGLDDDSVQALADAIADFRDDDDLRRLRGAEDDDYAAAGLPYGAKDAPFETVGELRQVLGVTEAVFLRLAPAVTVYSGEDLINPLTAPPATLFALPEVEVQDVETFLGVRSAHVLARGGDGERAGSLDVSSLAGADNYIDTELEGAVYTIRAEARSPGGAIFVREAVVRLEVIGDAPFAIYSWRRGEAPPRDDPQQSQ